MMGKLKKLTGYRLFLPLSCLIIVLLINLITTPRFLGLRLITASSTDISLT